jgi:hypothetical protein
MLQENLPKETKSVHISRVGLLSRLSTIFVLLSFCKSSCNIPLKNGSFVAFSDNTCNERTNPSSSITTRLFCNVSLRHPTQSGPHQKDAVRTWHFELLRCTVLQSAVLCLLFCHGDQLTNTETVQNNVVK